jgi:hypothetical protein
MLSYRALKQVFVMPPRDLQQTPRDEDFLSDNILIEVELKVNWLGEESMYVSMEDWLASRRFVFVRRDTRMLLGRGFCRQQMGAAVPLVPGRGRLHFF